jgi:predicted DNA-binding ribbon-helix-helix protein
MRRSRPGARSSSILRGVYVGARRTTLRLEPIMWEALAEIAEERGRSVHDILTEISRKYDQPNLSSAVRVCIVEFYRQRRRLQPSRRERLG